MTQHRIQLDFDEVGFKDLEEIRVLAGLPNCAITIGNALAVYRFVLEQEKAQSELLVRHPGGEVEKVVFSVEAPHEVEAVPPSQEDLSSEPG